MHAPTRVRRMRSNYAPWLTENVKKAINYSDFQKKRAVKTSSDAFHEDYKQERNHVKKLVKTTKAQYTKH